MKKFWTIFCTFLILSPAVQAGIPYETIAPGMAFRTKEMAASFYAMSQERDQQGQMLLMANCTAQNTCVMFEEGASVYLEAQAEYPLIKIRIKGDPTHYWTLGNVIGL
jgi:hypothetical protein